MLILPSPLLASTPPDCKNFFVTLDAVYKLCWRRNIMLFCLYDTLLHSTYIDPVPRILLSNKEQVEERFI